MKIFERTALELGKELIQSPTSKGDQLLFARLLCGGNPDDITDPENLKALRFPNPEHVYLVNDRPVITFWGFLENMQLHMVILFFLYKLLHQNQLNQLYL